MNSCSMVLHIFFFVVFKRIFLLFYLKSMYLFGDARSSRGHAGPSAGCGGFSLAAACGLSCPTACGVLLP